MVLQTSVPPAKSWRPAANRHFHIFNITLILSACAPPTPCNWLTVVNHSGFALNLTTVSRFAFKPNYTLTLTLTLRLLDTLTTYSNYFLQSHHHPFINNRTCHDRLFHWLGPLAGDDICELTTYVLLIPTAFSSFQVS